MRAVEVRDESQVADARRAFATVAGAAGFNDVEGGRASIVASELATNVLKHGGGGVLLVGMWEDNSGSGIECLALDRGAGMHDVDACLRDGYSTSGTAGTGLGAIMRQSHLVDIYSRAGEGTAVLARLCRGKPARMAAQAAWGAVAVPKPGEEACGDSWAVEPNENGLTMIVADGLGHGTQAAEASGQAVRIFERAHMHPTVAILELLHDGLRPTRGAAVSVARIALAQRSVAYAGIGNVAGTLMDGAVAKKMVSHNGTVGHNARRIQQFDYGFSNDPLVVLASDGIGTSWTLDRYPGLAMRHPTLIAGVLFRDFSRGRDDATVLVARP